MARNNFFAFKQFSVNQASCGMKVTTDACIFGAWAPVEHARRILDIGTGTGLLALMAAQRSMGSIDAVEMDASSATAAEVNFINSPWPDRLRMFHARVQEFYPIAAPYDVILCNPPFYLSGTRSPGSGRANSRHADSLSHEELLDVIDRLLAPKGTVCVLLPEEIALTFTRRAQSRNLQESERLYVHSAPRRPPHCRAVVYSRTASVPPVEKTLFILTGSGTYTSETQILLRPFYHHI